MGGKNSAPEPPDYSKIAAASKQSARYSYKLGKSQLAWAKKQYASDRKVVDRIVNSAMKRTAENDRFARADRRRYERLFQPLENELVQDSRDMMSEERQRYEMNRAQATVAQQFEAQRRQAMQNLESFGVDPSSTRYAALDAGSRVMQAAAQAGAGNQARAQTEAIGRAMRSEAINVGRGYPGQIAGTYGTALQSGNQAVNSALAGTASGASTTSAPMSWRASASGICAGAMPQPLSAMAMRFTPPASSRIVSCVAPASSAFSSNSLTTAEGRSITSPAAICEINWSGSWRMMRSARVAVFITRLYRAEHPAFSQRRGTGLRVSSGLSRLARQPPHLSFTCSPWIFHNCWN